ncbi:sensor histidine kinase [Parapedobacter sp. 2B3]|uniref:sensor histidine kinase n=1 Tax=Parapedobacter sp. 2B3 TaxID=3342381 RepID=UPI0035B5ECF4
MIIEPLFALLLVDYLRKKVDPRQADYDIRGYLLKGRYVAIGLLILDVVTNSFIIDVGIRACVVALMWLIYTRKELGVGKSLMYSIIPYMVLSFAGDLVEEVAADFYDSYEYVFESANLFGVLWFGAMWFVNRSQRKALERERIKREAEETRVRVMAELKVNLEAEVAQRTAELRQQKEELEEALEELKHTQAQLIHSEKMASLGELTAGIAHEIQNPLNFVNNFSEVSIELLDELKTGPLAQLPEDAADEVEELIGDLTQNLEKITLHGKRADGIVKSMLQHSRSSTGEKTEIDINALADEYIRLSYHGLRAKDKSFNASMETDFATDLRRIAVVPQDLGRVLLNLFNNAFYSVSEKKKNNAPEGYEPLVAVATRNVQLPDGREGVQITIRDNGTGIPKAIIDKVYQPFFTTKPTGQGTGLGLSMSYDIIHKVHGGEMRIDTEEGQYAAFTITIPA